MQTMWKWLRSKKDLGVKSALFAVGVSVQPPVSSCLDFHFQAELSPRSSTRTAASISLVPTLWK